MECDLVSVIMPVHNAALFLADSLESVRRQTHRPLQIVVFDDHSTDDSWTILTKWRTIFTQSGIDTKFIQSGEEVAMGPGYGRNNCVLASDGTFLCHLDADDTMVPHRIEAELIISKDRGDNCLVGSNFTRIPTDATPYYTAWLNGLNDDDICLQQYRECTIICPSWFMHRQVYDRIANIRGGRAFVEEAKHLSRVPEDLYFFLDHLEHGGILAKSQETLVGYRYSPHGWSVGSKSVDLQRVRAEYLQRQVLDKWETFSIWGYGRDGRKFINFLRKENAVKVKAYCDVDVGKIGMDFFCNYTRQHIPVIDYRSVTSPFIVCVGSKRYSGELEENIKSLHFVEGVDYFHFC